MNITFKTKDFNIYLFDKNDTKIDNVNKIDVCILIKNLENDGRKKAFISPSNVLGFMDGGVDLGYMNSLPNIQQKVQNGFKVLGIKSLLNRNYLPIGNSMAFELDENKWFVSSPTMLFPQKVLGTRNQYYALTSVLQLCAELKIKDIYCPMMCTGYGGYNYTESYDLMKVAIQDYTENTSFTIIKKEDYIYNIQYESYLCDITKLQPKIYCNNEFYVEL